ncbi:hypothetical protein FXV77_01055 [Sphingobacterium phlebotomi]|uniref:Uncharacterized protein n=1 Tax=Sphingobacterium phlebotomi TaxID=2605433 RepID=A0A5D4HE91_9SPHI|nr:hypothetical protein [Sphingobacterium phlebotomi]TYR37905.1 hypothetical protein FXV77_01055 [Sphingobacterium phlebotomi]
MESINRIALSGLTSAKSRDPVNKDDASSRELEAVTNPIKIVSQRNKQVCAWRYITRRIQIYAFYTALHLWKYVQCVIFTTRRD